MQAIGAAGQGNRVERLNQIGNVIQLIPEAREELAADCYEASGQFDKAAAIYLQLGDREKALRCFRSVPDFASALSLVKQMEAHPARAPLEWLGDLDALLARRPENFNRATTLPWKKLPEAMLERGLGVQRKKPTTKKASAIGRSAALRHSAVCRRHARVRRAISDQRCGAGASGWAQTLRRLWNGGDLRQPRSIESDSERGVGVFVRWHGDLCAARKLTSRRYSQYSQPLAGAGVVWERTVGISSIIIVDE